MAFTENMQHGCVYMTSDKISAKHMFTTRIGGVSKGVFASWNLGVHRGDDDAAVLIERPPIRFIPRIAVHRVKRRGRIGVHIVRLFAELAGQIHLDQCAGIAGIVREAHFPHRSSFGSQLFGQQLCLCGLAAAVQPFQHDQLSLAHACSPFSAA